MYQLAFSRVPTGTYKYIIAVSLQTSELAFSRVPTSPTMPRYQLSCRHVVTRGRPGHDAHGDREEALRGNRTAARGDCRAPIHPARSKLGSHILAHMATEVRCCPSWDHRSVGAFLLSPQNPFDRPRMDCSVRRSP
jgi:hypothetical protein